MVSMVQTKQRGSTHLEFALIGLLVAIPFIPASRAVAPALSKPFDQIAAPFDNLMLLEAGGSKGTIEEKEESLTNGPDDSVIGLGGGSGPSGTKP